VLGLLESIKDSVRKATVGKLNKLKTVRQKEHREKHGIAWRWFVCKMNNGNENEIKEVICSLGLLLIEV
jgi:hypothetical protein